MSVPALRPVGLPPVGLAAIGELARADLSNPRDRHVAISGVTLHSGDVRPGDLFLALPGAVRHGAEFAGQVAAAGAAAILTDRDGLERVRANNDAADVPVLVCDAPRAVIGAVSAAVYDHPSRNLRVVGITGTSGKTTTSYLTEGALAAAGRMVGLIGTVGAKVAGRPLPSSLTTPEAPDLQAMLAVMRQRGVDTVAMEVSSHALSLGRVDGTDFAVGVFTNLSQDHLDFHEDMEHYFAAKSLLFDGRAAVEIVVIDDDYGRRLAVSRPRATTVSSRAGSGADWTVSARQSRDGRQHLRVSGPDGIRVDTTIDLPGAFNVTNAATALACAHAVGADVTAAASGLGDVHVPGRLQRIDAGQPFLALVDYAHKPGAVTAVLAAVRHSCRGRIIIVLGAGGDRDHGKRPLMGANAVRGANVVIVTDDNPRSEDPAAIRAQILEGARAVGGAIREIGDRREAIRAALAEAAPGDAVIIAGKGHEPGQEVAGVVYPFSDADEVTAALADLGYGRAAP